MHIHGTPEELSALQPSASAVPDHGTGTPQRRADLLHRAALPGALALLYYALFMAYQWRAREDELRHWLSLVALPLGIITIGMVATGQRPALRSTLASVGLRRGNLRRGLLAGALIGLLVSSVGLLLNNHRGDIWRIIVTGKVLYYLPLVIVLLLFTAGFTEEFFFRGVLQTRLADWWGSDLAALLVTALLFGLYHLPYLYLSAAGSGHVHLLPALAECGLDAAAGALLGLVYWKSGRNLLAGVMCHVLFDALPAMALIH
jgi:membrane protease YdiL (CAAX protease family)